MNERQALTKARALLGPKAAVQWNPNAPDAEEKAAQYERFKVAHAAAADAVARRDALRAELLSDPRYVALRAECHRTRVAADKARPTSRSRATVGTASALFFTVEAEGDSFGEAFAEIEAKRNGSAT